MNRNLLKLAFIVLSLLSSGVSGAENLAYVDRIQNQLTNPLLHQGLVNSTNYEMLNKLSQNYPKQNTLNVGWLSVFRRYNSGETVQNRTALETQRSESQIIFDMDGDRPLDWSQVKIDSDNEANFSAGQYVLSLDTTNIKSTSSPVLLVLLSNQHTVNDYLSNPASRELAKLGYTVAVLEYPNYGASLGKASLQSWLGATRGALRFLNGLTQKGIYLVGHSVGGPLALQAAAGESVNGQVAGVITYGGFSNLYEMSKDQQSNPFIRFLSKPITFLTLKDNIIDGISSLDILAKKQVPVLVMHGRHDGAVTVRHTELFAAQIQQQKLPLMKTQIFENLYHEEINNLSHAQPQDFYQVWDFVTAFILNRGSTKN